MPTLTRENAKHHCRTCLSNLLDANSGEDVTNISASYNASGLNKDEDQEFKDIYINIMTNGELQQLITKYIDVNIFENVQEIELPQNLCLRCYNKLQSFEKFRKRALTSAEKLYAVLINNGVTKVEIDYEDADQETGLLNTDDDIYKLLLKDTLMETESVMLDTSTSATLPTEEVQDPDPFRAASPSKDLSTSGESSGSADEGGYDWQKNADNENGSSNPTSSDSEAEEDIEVNSNSEVSVKNQLPRLRKRKEVSTIAKPEKKRRRTKMEMEEWRRSQGEKHEKNNKRRNKGTKNSFKCTQCNHCFAHKITLDAHIRKVHEGSKRPFQCDRCDKSYTFIGGLYTHIKEIHEAEVRSYTCDYPGCERNYTSFIAMQKHKRLKHTDVGHQKTYVCEQCGSTFNQTGNLKYHRRTKHPTDADLAEKEKSKERYECDICKKLFHSRYTLKYHTLQLHSGVLKYECNICGRRMAKKFMLVQHMLVHSTDKMPCEHCGKQFIRKFELEAHIRAVHMKLKPFECQYCCECFASRKTLRHHEYIHTGEKPYVCDICGQAYRQQTCLKNHRKSHDKLSAEALLAANINRTLMNSFLGPGPQPPCVTGPPLNG